MIVKQQTIGAELRLDQLSIGEAIVGNPYGAALADRLDEELIDIRLAIELLHRREPDLHGVGEQPQFLAQACRQIVLDFESGAASGTLKRQAAVATQFIAQHHDSQCFLRREIGGW